MSRATAHRRQASGQALIESAIVIPILFAMFLGFLALGVAAQSYVDLNTAVNLAAASAVTAPANSPAVAQGYATDTYDVTLSHFPLLSTNGTVRCFPVNGAWGPTGDPPQPWPVTCTGSAYLRFSRTALAVVVPVDPLISATATADGSPYRSSGP